MENNKTRIVINQSESQVNKNLASKIGDIIDNLISKTKDDKIVWTAENDSMNSFTAHIQSSHTVKIETHTIEIDNWIYSLLLADELLINKHKELISLITNKLVDEITLKLTDDLTSVRNALKNFKTNWCEIYG